MSQIEMPLAKRIEALVASNGQSKTALRDLLGDFHPADIAEILDELSNSARLALFNILPRATASEVLDETDPEVLRFVFDHLPDERLAVLLDELPSDDAARLLSDLREEDAETLIQLMRPADAADVRDLLAYPENSAGRLMTDRFARLNQGWDVSYAIEYLRSTDRETDIVTYLYVIDEDELLVGVVPLRALLTAQPEKTITEIMLSHVISVRADTDREEVAEIVAKYDFAAMPVTDERGRLVGVVTVDDVMDVLEAEVTEDIQRLGGSEPLDQPYFTVSVVQVARKRIGWLLLLFIAETFTGSVLRIFEDELAQVVALSFFIPLLIGTGGNTGSQTVSTIIRAVAVGEIEWRDLWRVLRREVTTGLLVGALLGIIGFGRALLWGTSLDLALVVGLTLPVICTWANTVGSLVPIIAERVGIDPTVVSAPLITTLVDATGLAIYLLIARALLGL